MKLPTDINGWELASISVKLGFEIQRQSGSHLILKIIEICQLAELI